MMRLRLVLTIGVRAAAAAPADAIEPFVGRWGVSQEACSGYGNTVQTAPLIATQTRVRWYPGTCRIGKMYKLGTAVYIQAHCFGDSASDMPITLETRGGKLRVTWNRGRTEELQRCK